MYFYSLSQPNLWSTKKKTFLSSDMFVYVCISQFQANVISFNFVANALIV